MKKLGAGLLLAAVFAVPAHAANMGDFARAQKVAESYFRPDCSVVLRWQGTRLATTPGYCWITFPRASWRQNWAWICTAMVHSYGHLSGLPDSKSRRSVMHRPPLSAPKKCGDEPFSRLSLADYVFLLQ